MRPPPRAIRPPRRVRIPRTGHQVVTRTARELYRGNLDDYADSFTATTARGTLLSRGPARRTSVRSRSVIIAPRADESARFARGLEALPNRGRRGRAAHRLPDRIQQCQIMHARAVCDHDEVFQDAVVDGQRRAGTEARVPLFKGGARRKPDQTRTGIKRRRPRDQRHRRAGGRPHQWEQQRRDRPAKNASRVGGRWGGHCPLALPSLSSIAL